MTTAERKAIIGHKIRRFRKNRDLSQTQMASMIGISPSYLNLIEHNQRPVTVSLLFRLGQAFEVDLKEFAEDDEARFAVELGEVFSDPLFEGAARGGAYAQDKKVPQKIIEIYHRTSYGFSPVYESRIGVGVKYQKKNIPVEGSLLELRATRGLRGRSSYGIGLQKERFLHDRLDFSLGGGYRFYSDDDFFGIGPRTRTSGDLAP